MNNGFAGFLESMSMDADEPIATVVKRVSLDDLPWEVADKNGLVVARFGCEAHARLFDSIISLKKGVGA